MTALRAFLPRITMVDALTSNAKNNIWGIRIRKGIEMPAAVLAQEYAEYWMRWRWSLLFAVPFWALLAWQGRGLDPGVIAFLAFMGFAVGVICQHFIPRLRRSMEYMGHEIEVQAAVMLYGADETATRRREATSMVRLGSSYSFLHGFTPDQATAAMARLAPKAAEYVRRRAGWLRGAKTWFEGNS